MSIKVVENKLYSFTKPNRWMTGLGAHLPEAYSKFWREWKLTKPSPVHYIQKPGYYERNPDTGVVQPVQTVPLVLKYPKEINQGIWGGEAVVQGFTQKNILKRRVPHYWIPLLKKSVVYSEVLNTYMRVTVTNRTLKLIHENYGFDHYLLNTPACDLRSELALKLKRNILIALADKTLYPEDSQKREKILKKYEHYLESYTREEIEWYGLNFNEACKKFAQEAPQEPIEPLKHKFRAELLAELKEGIDSTGDEKRKSSWLSKINPFSKTPATTQ